MATRPSPTVILIGALPPPHMGPTLATALLLRSKLTEAYRILHLDTSDHRPMTTLAVIDWENISNALSSYFRLFVMLITNRVDIVYIPISQVTIGYLRDSIFILISKLFGKKVVTHLRGGYFRTWFTSCGSLMKWYIRRVHSLVDAQIVLGENLRRLFDGIIDERKVHVVPNGLNVPRPPDHSEREGICFLFLSNLLRTKGVLEFVNAAVKVHEARPETRFVLAGSSATRKTEDCSEDLEHILKRQPSLPITMPGTVRAEEKLQHFREADVFVFPTYYPLEGHPWVLVEAMAASLPIISCDQAAVTESVRDGVNGFIVPQRDPNALADAMIRLVDDPETRRRMGRASRQLYEDELTEDRMVARLAAVFDAVLAPRTPAPAARPRLPLGTGSVHDHE